jgi:tetratricopeptide (TPR) repeat protein
LPEAQPSAKSASSKIDSAASTVVPDAIFHPVLPPDLPLLQNDSQNPDEWIQQGIEFYRQVKNAAALECYERALKLMQLEPDPTKAEIVEGLSLAAKRQLQAALPLLQSLPTLMPEYASLWRKSKPEQLTDPKQKNSFGKDGIKAIA